MRIVVDSSEWWRLLRRAYRRSSVLFCGAAGLCCLVAGGFSSGFWQGMLVNLGTALVLLPPIVVTERLALEQEVASIRDEFRRVSNAQELARERESSLETLFVKSNNYSADDLLLLMKECSKAHSISRFGIAVPLVPNEYSLLLGFKLETNYSGGWPIFSPGYVIDAQESVGYRILREEEDDGFKMQKWGIIGGRLGGTTASALMDVRDELLELDLHPPRELDFDWICKQIKDTMLARIRQQRPGFAGRTGLGSVIALVGQDLAITTESIEHRYDKNFENLPIYIFGRQAGIEHEPPPDDATITVTQPDGSVETLPVNEYSTRDSDRRFNEGRMSKHPDIDAALQTLSVLIRSGFYRWWR